MTTAPMTLNELLTWHARKRFVMGGSCKDIPPTIDAIADLLPPGWTWTCSDRWWFAFPPANPKVTLGVTVKRTGDEKHDRALLAKLAWEQEATK